MGTDQRDFFIRSEQQNDSSQGIQIRPYLPLITSQSSNPLVTILLIYDGLIDRPGFSHAK